jgi:hypothetical protein
VSTAVDRLRITVLARLAPETHLRRWHLMETNTMIPNFARSEFAVRPHATSALVTTPVQGIDVRCAVPMTDALGIDGKLRATTTGTGDAGFDRSPGSGTWSPPI